MDFNKDNETKARRHMYHILALHPMPNGTCKVDIYVGSAKSENLDARIRQEIKGDEVGPDGRIMHQAKFLKSKHRIPIACIYKRYLGNITGAIAKEREHQTAFVLNEMLGGAKWFGEAYGN